MKLCSLILLIGIIFHYRTTATTFRRDDYTRNVNAYAPGYVTRIRYLNLSDMGIKRINPRLFDYLNVEELNLSNNEITKIPKYIFSNLIGLETLSLANNRIEFESGSFIGLRNLKVLNLSNTGLLDIEPSSLYGISKSASILCDGNGLRKIYSTSFESPIKFATDAIIFRSKKSIRNPPLPYNSDLQICKTDGTIKSISIWTNEPTVDDCTRDYRRLQFYDLNLAAIGLNEVSYDWWQMGDYQVKSLDLSNNRITEITPQLLNELPESLNSVTINENKITMIKRNVINNSHIKTLNLEHNLISKIEDGAFENTQLEFLSLSFNHLKDVDFAKTLPMSIYHLDLTKNGITKIEDNSFTSLKSLGNLVLDVNEITDIAVGTFQGLKTLHSIKLSSNRLENIKPGTFDNLERLSGINLAFNNINEIDSTLSRNTPSLIWIDLRNNNIKNISKNTFSGLKNRSISRIDLSSNKINFIEEGSFADMTLKDLILSNNRITEESIARGAFKQTSIFILHLNGNLMTTINGESFYGISNVTSLMLHDNRIKSIKKGAAEYLGGVDELTLWGNPLEVLESGALYGLSKKRDVSIWLNGAPIKVIHADVFDDV